jgi:hypothetical protein
MLACLLPSAAALDVHAQIKTLPGEKITVSATVEAIEQATRKLIVKGPKGQLRTLIVPEDVKRFPEIKVGDTITATYYDNITFRLKKPDEKDVDTMSDAVTPSAGTKPGGTSAAQQIITATVDAIDMNVPSISFKGPRGWSYSTRVRDKKALSQVKVGDRVDITWTEAMLLSLDTKK